MTTYGVDEWRTAALAAVYCRGIRRGAELGPIVDRQSGLANSKAYRSAAGYLTDGLVPRDMDFEIAVAYALAPFLHPELNEPRHK